MNLNATSETHPENTIECDVAIIGGSLGGVAAALATAENGLIVILSESTNWIGGQITNQGVAPLDEHPLIESFGGTQRYHCFRATVRQAYQRKYDAPVTMPDGTPLNPGNGWVSRLCFEPKIGLEVLKSLLAPHLQTGQLRIFTGFTPVRVQRDGTHLQSVYLQGRDGDEIVVKAAYFLDATDTGKLLPLAQVPFVTGAEAWEDTREPNASRNGAHPERVQGFTYPFLVEHCPGEDHTIPKPPGYEINRARQPYSLVLRNSDGDMKHYPMFDSTPECPLSFWTYRRVFAAQLLGSDGPQRDIALINWSSNDYHWGNILTNSSSEIKHHLFAAKALSLGFLYYLQTEVPRDDGRGYGYPGLRLLSDGLGSLDGLSLAPYIRESRRLIGCRRVLEQDISAAAQAGARAAHFNDSVGVGWYALDLHASYGDHSTAYAPTRPFQIPLGAFISDAVSNLLPACKNIATTHLTNGAYRVHPVEWNIGETAGELAVFCIAQQRSPYSVWQSQNLLRQFQHQLIKQGIPLVWTSDIPPDHLAFERVQYGLVQTPFPNGIPRYKTLAVGLDDPACVGELTALLEPRLQMIDKLVCGRFPWEQAPLMELISPASLKPVLTEYDIPISLHGAIVTLAQLLDIVAILDRRVREVSL